MKLQLPEGAREGCLVKVTWPQSEAEKVTPGTFEGRLLKINGDKIIVKFIYNPEDEVTEEQISIDLRSGIDFKYHAAVVGIELVGRR